MTIISQFPNIIVKFSWRCLVSLVKFSYWSKLHVNIITGSGVMTISFYKGLARNPEIGNTPVWVFPISGDWGEQGIRNLARTFLIKCYHMLQYTRITAFTVSELLRENQQGGGGNITLPPLSLRLRFIKKTRLSKMLL